MVTKEKLSVNDIRNRNRFNIISTILAKEGITRQELARENHISPMTVKHIADELVLEDIVTEQVREVSYGRKPMELRISSWLGTIVCVNVTSPELITYVIYNLSAEELVREEILRKNRSYHEMLDETIKKIHAWQQNAMKEIVGIGIFTPGAYDSEKDLVNYDLIGEFSEIRFREVFENAFRLTNIQVVHDTYSAANAEYADMNPEESQYYLYLGVGVGGAFIYSGTTVLGENHVAGDAGKIRMFNSISGQYEFVEDIASTVALTDKIKKVMPEKSLEEVLDAFNNNNLQASEILLPVLDCLTVLIGNICWMYNPTRIVIDSHCREYANVIKTYASKKVPSLMSDIPHIGIRLETARHNEYQTMNRCMQMVRELWIQEISSGSYEKQGVKK